MVRPDAALLSVGKKNFFPALARKDDILAFGAELSSCKYRLTLARYRAMGDFVLREAQLGKQTRKTPLTLLDIGCGEGRLILYGPFPDVKFSGIDVSQSSLETARKRGYAEVMQGNLADRLAGQDESFDIVVCSHILEHLPDPGKMVSEVMRVLRPGGLFILGVPICMWWTRLLRIRLVPLLVPKKRPELLASGFGHVVFFTLPSLRALLGNFQIEDIRGFRFFSAGRYLPLENWRWYYRLNTAWGKVFPRLTSEVNVIARKPLGIRK